MIYPNKLPANIDLLLDGEYKEFVVHPNKKYPLRTSFIFLAFGIFLIMFISIFALVFVGGFLDNNPFTQVNPNASI